MQKSIFHIFLALGFSVLSVTACPQKDAPMQSQPTENKAQVSDHAKPADQPADQPARKPADKPDQEPKAPFVVASVDALPAGPQKDSILRGKAIAENTRGLLPEHVGNGLRCAHCHLGAGTTQNAAPWVGIAARFPQYRARTGKEDTLTDRINDCFERSMNGKALDPQSQPMQDLLAWMSFLSEGYTGKKKVEGMGIPLLTLARDPDLEAGKKVYQAKCISCHGPDGMGVQDPATKQTVFPALGGDHSFNIGAGMARLYTAAGFVKKNMPFGQGGTLSDDEAWDVAAYFTQMPRPDFARKHLDWPKGNKPKDARY